MNKSQYPLVSCLCLTHHKVDLLKRSMNCFFNQTYPNKELVLVYTDDNYSTINYLNQVNDVRVKKVKIPSNKKLTLGEKRNISISESNGYYICIWDDDDWYMNSRIEYQVKRLTLSQKKVSMLNCIILFDTIRKEAFLSQHRPSPQSMLCEKSIINFREIKYESMNRGEDSTLSHILFRYSIVDESFNPCLYIYNYHGRNTWNLKFWKKYHIDRRRQFPNEKFDILENIVNGEISRGEVESYMNRVIYPFSKAIDNLNAYC